MAGAAAFVDALFSLKGKPAETPAQTQAAQAAIQARRALTDRVNSIMEEMRGPAGRNMWEKLSNVQEEILANYLKNEYPQTVAVVLSKIKAENAARVLAILPDDLALDVINRLLRMESIQK